MPCLTLSKDNPKRRRDEISYQERIPTDLNILSGLSPDKDGKYTVPAIQHVPTGKCMVDSTPIAKFIESTYPDPPVTLTSELGDKIAAQARSNAAKAVRISITPREVDILSPRSQEFFRRTREASLGHPLEDLLDAEKEEQAWESADGAMKALDELMRTNSADGPFILGSKPNYTDFFIAGNLQCARMVDESIFQRLVKYPGQLAIYEACVPYMDKRD